MRRRSPRISRSTEILESLAYTSNFMTERSGSVSGTCDRRDNSRHVPRAWEMHLSGAALCNFRPRGGRAPRAVRSFSPSRLISSRIVSHSSCRASVLEIYSHPHFASADLESRTRQIGTSPDLVLPGYSAIIGCTERGIYGTRFDFARGYNNVSKLIRDSHIYPFFYL